MSEGRTETYQRSGRTGAPVEARTVPSLMLHLSMQKLSSHGYRLMIVNLGGLFTGGASVPKEN